MVELTVLEFDKKEIPQYNDMYQEIKTLIKEKYSDFSIMEIIGILECMAMEFKHKAMIFPDEQPD